MSKADYLAMRWLNDEFLSERSLAEPDGRPLHAYRCTDAELAALTNRLTEAGIAGASAERHLAALFCLFTAEWWRRRYDGSAWGWEPVFSYLGTDYDWQTASALTTRGLAFWKRVLRRSAHGREFLLTLVLEGGLPLGLLAAGKGRLTDHLRRVLGELDRLGPDAELGRRLSEQHAHVLPASFRRPEVHALIGDLLAAVLCRRDGIPASVPAADAVAWLDANAPRWRDQLPLPVDDDAARGLLAGLIRETVALRGRAPGLNALVGRILVNDGAAWRPMLAFTMGGILSRGGPVPLEALPGSATRARLRAAGDLEGLVPGPLALLQAEGADRKEWRVEPLSAARRMVAWPLEAPAALSIRVDGATVHRFAPRGGEPAVQPPLVFDAADDDVEPTRLRLVGGGSMRTCKERLYVACRGGADLVPADGATVRALGPVAGTDLTLHEITGTVRWAGGGGDGLSIVFRTRSEDEERSRLTVEGRPPAWDVAAPLTVLGRPLLLEMSGGPAASGRPVPVGDLRWRPARGGPWRPLPHDGSWPLGLLDIVLVRGEEALDRLRLAVLPDTARVRTEPEGASSGRLLLEGFGDAELRVERTELGSGVEHMVNPKDGGTAIRLLASGKPPSRVPVVASWQGQGDVCCLLHFPVRGGGFIDARGRWMPPRARLHLDQLHGVRALADPGGDAEIFGWLRAPDLPDERRLWIRHRFQGACSLATLRASLLNLLAASQELDAVVQLFVRCAGVESAPVHVSRVDLELTIQGERVGIGKDGLATLDEADRADIELVCRPFADPGTPEESLPVGPPGEDGSPSWLFRKDGRTPGSWLIYGRVSGRHRFRPRTMRVAEPTAFTVGGIEQPVTADSLAAISRIADHKERQEELCRLLNALTADPMHHAWPEVDRWLQAIQGRLPFATLNVLQRLSERPEALLVFLARAPAPVVGSILAMQDELPFLWAALPIRSWLRAFATVERGLTKLLTTGGQAEETAHSLAARVVDATLVQVEEEHPALSCTSVLVREHLGRARVDDCTLAHLRVPFVRNSVAARLADLRMAVRRRNDGPEWPVCPDFRDTVTGLPQEHLDLPASVRPVLDAPFAAARIAAAGTRVGGGTLRALRLCRAFYPEWFDDAYAFALGLTLSEPDMISSWSD